MTSDTAGLWAAWATRRDEQAFETLVWPELPHAMRFARRLGCHQADAEDAIQDALARLASLHGLPTELGLRAWLCREVHTSARSRLRSERRRRRREASVAALDLEEEPAPEFELREEVDHALGRLDQEERIAVELRYLHDLDYHEMALVLGSSPGACRQRVQKALARLRERLGQNAATLVTALPLPPVKNAPSLVKAALAQSAVASATGATIVATATQKILVTAIVAVALGIVGTLAVQHVARQDGPRNAALDDIASNEIAKRDSEIERLRSMLATARKSRVSVQSPTAVPEETSRTGGTDVAPTAGAADSRSTASVPPATVALDTPAAEKQAEAWQAALRQVADHSKRDSTWAEVRAALAGADRSALYAALRASAFTRDVTLDRSGLRDLILPWVDAPEPPIKLAAWQALINNGIEPIDVAKLRTQVAAASDDNRTDLVLRLNWATKGVFEGENADVVLRLLSDAASRKGTIQALHGARLPDAIVAKVLEYARSGSDQARDAEHFVLRDLPDKNHDVVAYILDRAERGPLALEGLNTGVRADDVPYVGERLRKLYGGRNESYQRSQILETIGRVGDTASREWLVAIRDDATQDALIRSGARSAIQLLDRPRR